MYKIIVFISFLFVFISCADAEKIEDRNGALKIIITNNTDYDVKELYYKVGIVAPSYGNYGTKLNTEILADGDKIEFCPTEGGKYYFTFVRQNGSNDTNLYISSENSLDLSLDSGIIDLELLPFNFYYKTFRNSNDHCTISN